jgi:hypothetical protein
MEITHPEFHFSKVVKHHFEAACKFINMCTDTEVAHERFDIE